MTTNVVLVECWARWCAPCRILGPARIQLAAERAGALKLVEVDLDAAPGLAQRFSVQSVPTLLLFGAIGCWRDSPAQLPSLCCATGSTMSFPPRAFIANTTTQINADKEIDR